MKIDDITDHIGTGQYAAGYIDYTDGKVRFTEAYQYGTTLGRTNNVGKKLVTYATRVRTRLVETKLLERKYSRKTLSVQKEGSVMPSDMARKANSDGAAAAAAAADFSFFCAKAYYGEEKAVQGFADDLLGHLVEKTLGDSDTDVQPHEGTGDSEHPCGSASELFQKRFKNIKCVRSYMLRHIVRIASESPAFHVVGNSPYDNPGVTSRALEALNEDNKFAAKLSQDDTESTVTCGLCRGQKDEEWHKQEDGRGVDRRLSCRVFWTCCRQRIHVSCVLQQKTGCQCPRCNLQEGELFFMEGLRRHYICTYLEGTPKKTSVITLFPKLQESLLSEGFLTKNGERFKKVVSLMPVTPNKASSGESSGFFGPKYDKSPNLLSNTNVLFGLEEDDGESPDKEGANVPKTITTTDNVPDSISQVLVGDLEKIHSPLGVKLRTRKFLEYLITWEIFESPTTISQPKN